MYSEREEFLIWLSCFELSWKKREEILSKVKTLDDFRSAVDFGKTNLTDGEIFNLQNASTKTFLSMHLESLKKAQVFCITQASADYPQSLYNIPEPPHCLYCVGKKELLKHKCIAIVGTRQATRYGKTVAEKFAKELSDAGFVIVSGLADGIDTAGHSGVMQDYLNNADFSSPALTIAVLGGGFNYFYPKSNLALFNQMAKHSLVISEYAPNVASHPFHFPYRNRIVVGLSKGVVVPEAGEKSGTSHTVEYALNSGIDVFAVPGQINSPASLGTNRLIKSAQGMCVTNVTDILEHFGVNRKEQPKKAIQLDADEQLIINALAEGDLHIDQLIEKTKLDIKKLNNLLTKLTMNGILVKLTGNYYEISDN
ncbi:MAG: DNA-processing protein DprA [Firmicutes bacterium]|nr:DNA-processing protein DprA [Bacillota bacterium]